MGRGLARGYYTRCSCMHMVVTGRWIRGQGAACGLPETVGHQGAYGRLGTPLRGLAPPPTPTGRAPSCHRAGCLAPHVPHAPGALLLRFWCLALLAALMFLTLLAAPSCLCSGVHCLTLLAASRSLAPQLPHAQGNCRSCSRFPGSLPASVPQEPRFTALTPPMPHV
jgi:hypothetical protein